MKLSFVLLFFIQCAALVQSKSVVEHQVRVLDQDNDNTEQQPRRQVSWIIAGTKNQTASHDRHNHVDNQQQQHLEKEDPMLATMPGEFSHFKAYRRADISSFYQEPPGSRIEQTPSFTGQAGKFVNMSPERLELHWYVYCGNDDVRRNRENVEMVVKLQENKSNLFLYAILITTGTMARDLLVPLFAKRVPLPRVGRPPFPHMFFTLFDPPRKRSFVRSP